MRSQYFHVGVSVTDLGAMTAPYADASDFTIEGSFEVEQHGLRGSLLSHESGLELLERAGSEAVGDYSDPLTAALVRGYGHIALEVDDVDESFEHLISAGAKEIWSPRPAPVPGSRMSYVADQEGNMIELVSPA